MSIIEKINSRQDFKLMAKRREHAASMKSNEEIFFKVAKNILLNPSLTFDDKILLLCAAIPTKSIITQSIQRLYSMNQIEWNEYVLFDTYF
ncbi:MAG: hypothetical protein GPJ54_08705 [Candidatus Heimdallarchaeota archaeon]|nr:hypothetical protein [Candidatus Heimdallarchaeota archaeon]